MLFDSVAVIKSISISVLVNWGQIPSKYSNADRNGPIFGILNYIISLVIDDILNYIIS